LYLAAFLPITSSAGYSAAMSRAVMVYDAPIPLGMGTIGQATNNTVGYVDGGVLSAQTGALPASIALGDIRQTSNIMPYFKIGAI